MSDVRLEGVHKRFDDVEVIRGIDLDVRAGEFVTFVGQSGSGKSTLLRMIAGLESVSDGSVLIGGEDVTFREPSERGIAMVFQSYALYPHMNVRDNIAFNLKLAKVARDDIDRRVAEAARILKLEPLLDRSPGQLSGGQRQRVAIGRAIVREPKVFLFDEPLSNLDAALRVQMRLEIERLHRSLDSTMIYVTHDQVEAMTLADRIVALEDGRLQQVAAPMEMYARPSNLFVAGFIGSPKMNFFDAVVDAADPLSASVRIDGHAGARGTLPVPDWPGGHEATLGVRPESVVLDSVAGARGSAVARGAASRDDAAPDALVLDGRVETVERLGNIAFVHVDCGARELTTVQVLGETPHAVGDEVRVRLPLERLHLFASDGAAVVSPRTARDAAA